MHAAGLGLPLVAPACHLDLHKSSRNVIIPVLRSPTVTTATSPGCTPTDHSVTDVTLIG